MILTEKDKLLLSYVPTHQRLSEIYVRNKKIERVEIPNDFSIENSLELLKNVDPLLYDHITEIKRNKEIEIENEDDFSVSSSSEKEECEEESECEDSDEMSSYDESSDEFSD